MTTIETEQVNRKRTDREQCAGCGYRVTFQYKLDGEDIWNCGDCFASWLARGDAEVSIDG